MVRVLYVVGKGRSGSTLLDHLLGSMDGISSTGELWWLWRWGFLGGYRCGCGERIPDCGLWGPVGADLHRGGRTPRRIAAVQSELLSWHRVPGLLARAADPAGAASPAGGGTVGRALARMGEVYGELYRGIAERTGAGVVVDSSKFPAHPGLLGMVDGVEPHAVHLVRDPRAVTFSYRRHKLWRDRDGGVPMPTFGPAYSSASWLARNGTVEAVRQVRPALPLARIRYEDLVAEPRRTLRAIAALVGLPDADPPVDEQGTARLSTNHMVGGNPDRGARGAVELARDDEWRRAITGWDRAVTTAMCAPLMGRYGYLDPAPTDP